MAKPASGSTLNTGHTLYSSLAACWAMLEGSGTTSADSRGSRTLTFAGGGTPPTWSTDGAGDAVIAIGTAIANPLALASSLTLSSANAWSLAWRAKQDASGTAGIVCGSSTTSNNFLFFNGVTALRYRNSTPTDYDYASAQPFTTDANYLLTYDPAAASGTLRLYKDAAEVSGSPKTSVTGSLVMATLGGVSSVNTFALVGTITYLYVWDGRTLDGAEASALHADPYEFFGAGGAEPAAPSSLARSFARVRASHY